MTQINKSPMPTSLRVRIQRINLVVLAIAIGLVALVIFMPYGVVGSFMAWRTRRATKEGKAHAAD